MENMLDKSLEQMIEERKHHSSEEMNDGTSNRNRRNPPVHARYPRRKEPYSTAVPRRPVVEGEKKQKQYFDAYLKFLLPNHLTGTFIGGSGVAVKELMELSGAGVHVSQSQDLYPGTTMRVIYTTGSADSVRFVQSLIWEMIGQQTWAESEGVSDLKWDPIEATNYPGKYDRVQVEGCITIPASAGGMIVGKGGAGLRMLNEESGAKIEIDTKEEGEVTHERVIKLRGSVAGCMNCTSLILERVLKENPSGMEYVVGGTGYPKSLLLAAGIPASRIYEGGVRVDRVDGRRGGYAPGHGYGYGQGDRERERDMRGYSRVYRGGAGGEEKDWGDNRRGYGSYGGYGGHGSERETGRKRSRERDRDTETGRRDSRGGTSRIVALPSPGSGSTDGFKYPRRGSGFSEAGSLGLSIDSGEAGAFAGARAGFGVGGLPLEMLSASTQIELAVPNHLIGAILGIQGARLNEIMGLTGADIKIAPRGEFIEGTQNRLVRICGTPSSAQTAHSVIVHKLKQESERDRG